MIRMRTRVSSSYQRKMLVTTIIVIRYIIGSLIFLDFEKIDIFFYLILLWFFFCVYGVKGEWNNIKRRRAICNIGSYQRDDGNWKTWTIKNQPYQSLVQIESIDLFQYAPIESLVLITRSTLSISLSSSLSLSLSLSNMKSE